MSSDDLSLRSKATTLDRLTWQNETKQNENQKHVHAESDNPSNVLLKQIRPVNADVPNTLPAHNTRIAIDDSQNEPLVPGLVGIIDNRNAIQQIGKLIKDLQNKLNLQGLVGNVANRNIIEVQQIPAADVVNYVNKDYGPNSLHTDNTGLAITDAQNKLLVQGIDGNVDNRNAVQQSDVKKKNGVTVMLSSNDEKLKREHNFLDDFIAYPCMKGLDEFPPDKWATDGRCVRTVNHTESINKIIPGHKCVYVRTERRGRTIPICVYPAAMDKYVSASSMKGNLWESGLIFKMANYVRLEKQKQPNIEFLDLGSNIGCYSLYMAHEGIPVTAIDPLHSNMELISKSIIIGKLQDRMNLIWNAIADNHNIVKFIPDTNNVGGTRISDINPVENAAVMDVARAITFDDLLPLFRGKHIAMKMDIEESEYPALLGGEAFFQEVDVKVVQMEFMWHKKGKDGPQNS